MFEESFSFRVEKMKKGGEKKKKLTENGG